MNRNNAHSFLKPVFFMLSSVKSFKVIPKRNEYAFTSEYFALNWYIVTALTNKKLLVSLSCRFNTKCFSDSVKLTWYLASDAIVALSKPCIAPSPRTKIFWSYR